MKKLYIRKKIRMVITMFFSILTINVSAAPTSLQTKVTVSIPEPTCSVSAPEKVDMGILTPGMKINWLPDIDVKVNCSSEVAGYVVYMLSQNKQPSSHDGIYLKQGVTIQIYCFVFVVQPTMTSSQLMSKTQYQFMKEKGAECSRTLQK